MSVVGPRPALPNEVAAYNDYQRQRLLVKPGMTCYWQTRRNRDSITFDEWVDLDLWTRSAFKVRKVFCVTTRSELVSTIGELPNGGQYVSKFCLFERRGAAELC